MFNQFLSSTGFDLSTLFQAIEDEVLNVASRSERYLDAWDSLTPYSAVDLVLRRRSDFLWLQDRSVEQYDAELSTYIDKVRPAMVALQVVMNQAKVLDSASEIESKREEWLRIAVSEMARYRVQANEKPNQLAYERMLNVALAARLAKLNEVPELRRVVRTRESCLAIEQIRASRYAERTAFVLNTNRLPAIFQQGVRESKCLAVTVPDAWIAQCDAYVDFSAPSFSLVDMGQAGSECVLQLASGAVRLEASEVSRVLHQFDSELPVMFVGEETSALAIHEFLGLGDCASIRATLAHIGELDGLLPVFNPYLKLGDGAMLQVQVKSRVFDATSNGDILRARDLTGFPDAVDELPF